MSIDAAKTLYVLSPDCDVIEGAGPGADVVLDRVGARTSPKSVDADLFELVEEFRSPSTILAAVVSADPDGGLGRRAWALSAVLSGLYPLEVAELRAELAGMRARCGFVDEALLDADRCGEPTGSLARVSVALEAAVRGDPRSWGWLEAALGPLSDPAEHPHRRALAAEARRLAEGALARRGFP